MLYRPLVMVVALCLAALPVSGSEAKTERPTKFEPVDRSLTELLNDGWQVAALSHDIGMQFILQKDGQYVYCLLRTLASISGTDATSDCYRLN